MIMIYILYYSTYWLLLYVICLLLNKWIKLMNTLGYGNNGYTSWRRQDDRLSEGEIKGGANVNVH